MTLFIIGFLIGGGLGLAFGFFIGSSTGPSHDDRPHDQDGQADAAD